MKAFQKTVGCVAASVLLSLCSCAMTKEESADMGQAPPAVQAAAKALVGDKKIESFDKEQEKGQTVYEVEYKVDGTGYAASFNEAGDVIEHEIDIDQSAVPANILDVARKAHDGSTITEASIVNADGKLYYEFDVKAGDQKYELRVSAKGKINQDDAEKGEGAGKDEKDEKDEKK